MWTCFSDHGTITLLWAMPLSILAHTWSHSLSLRLGKLREYTGLLVLEADSGPAKTTLLEHDQSMLTKEGP